MAGSGNSVIRFEASMVGKERTVSITEELAKRPLENLWRLPVLVWLSNILTRSEANMSMVFGFVDHRGADYVAACGAPARKRFVIASKIAATATSSSSCSGQRTER
jgi:hypothetical protein